MADEQDDVELLEDFVPVKKIDIKDKDGQTTRYVLKPMGGPELGQWMKMVTDKQVAIRAGKNVDYKRFHAQLITMCLYTQDGDAVPIDTIFGWTAKLQQHLFGICQRMNGLDDDGADRAKKA